MKQQNCATCNKVLQVDDLLAGCLNLGDAIYFSKKDRAKEICQECYKKELEEAMRLYVFKSEANRFIVDAANEVQARASFEDYCRRRKLIVEHFTMIEEWIADCYGVHIKVG